MNKIALPLLAASLVSVPASAEVQLTSAGPVVELTVSEQVEIEPDIVNLGAGVTTQSATAVEAMRANAAAMSSVIARIKALGVAERDIRTTGINLGAQYDYDRENQRQVFRGYQASNRVSVKLRDVQKAGEVLDALVAAGATDLNGPDFTVEDDTAAKAQARERAMETARAQALGYARSAGYSDVRLLEVRESLSIQPPMPYMRAVRAEAADAPTPVQPGVVQSGVTVTVTYEMAR